MSYFLEFLNLLFRWFHVIAAVAWIGESIYFVMLDNSLDKPSDEEGRKKGFFGEIYAIHGGGFYHSQKYLTNPPKIPDNLHWSFWKSYTTWLSGFALFSLVYLTNPSFTLIDSNLSWQFAANMSGGVAAILSIAFLIGGWFIYDALCRFISPNMDHDGKLSIAVAIMMIIVSYLATHLFNGKAAFLIIGAVMATCMSANVFFWIIPGQRRMVHALKNGLEVDPLDGKRGKQRSVHNTYFTLPVIFLMLSNHYSFTFTTPYAWIVAVLFIFSGALIRQYFVLRHQGKNVLSLPITGGILLIIIGWICAPAPATVSTNTTDPGPTYAEVKQIINDRCVECHAVNGTIMPQPQKGIIFTDDTVVLSHADKIKELVHSKYMPYGNITKMTDEEREIIAKWKPEPQ